jgi:ribA/ribD-fused uncharacterized protein
MYTFFFESKSPFSNWYKTSFTLEEQKFTFVEQYMMWKKALLFKDPETAKKILKSTSAKEQKALGRAVKNFNPDVWNKHKENIVYTALQAKFIQNPDLAKQLVNTSPTLLVEASPHDKIWGIGYSSENALKVGKDKWGQNLLGKLLTKLRDQELIPKLHEKKISTLPVSGIKKYLNTLDPILVSNLKLYLDDLYYNTGDSTLDDERYDIVNEVASRDATSKEVASSKRVSVGAKLREGENRVELPFWLGSADKITPTDTNALTKWVKANPTTDYVVSEKLDGVSCLLVNKNRKLSLYTRGDGTVGADISYLQKYFNIPPLKEDITVRGELIMPISVFTSEHSTTYKNPRNMVSGLISGKTARKGLEDVHFVAYEVVGDSMPPPSSQLEHLASLNFEVVKYVSKSRIDMDILSKLHTRFREDSEYELDGIIVQSDQPYDRNTSGNPEYMFAFKMLTEDAIHETTVKSIEWNVSKWGQLKPVVIIEPVEASGVTMTRATAHNAKYVEENNLGKGAIIKVTRSKEVIPYITEVVKQAEYAGMPDVEYVWDKNHVNISVKKYDDTICIKLISSFFSKLGIKHVSEATVSKMFANGLDNLLKIISADKKRLLKIPEFQEKSAERIYTNIRNGLKNVKVATIIGSSGVLGFGIGRKRMDALLLDIPNILTLYREKSRSEMINRIVKVEGFSFITAEKIVNNLKYADMLIEKLKPYATFQEDTRVSEDLKGQKIVMSGFRDKKMEESIAQRGGKVTGTVSGNTTALIVPNKGGKLTGKGKKASDLGIPIYEKEEFVKQFLI